MLTHVVHDIGSEDVGNVLVFFREIAVGVEVELGSLVNGIGVLPTVLVDWCG